MSQKFYLMVAVVAGMIGSAIMHYAAPPLAFAQDQSSITKEVRAQSFVLIDSSNNVIGTFTSEPLPGFQARVAPGTSVTVPSHIVLRDANGRLIWTPDNYARMVPLTIR